MKTVRRFAFCTLVICATLISMAADQSVPSIDTSKLPDTFFYTIVDGGRLQTFYTAPTSLNADTTAWWQACAKFVALKRTNHAFNVAYAQAEGDIAAIRFPADISPEQFRSPSKEKRDTIRRFLVAETNRIMAQHGIFTTLVLATVPYEAYEAVLDELQADLRNSTGQSDPENLFHYCPGAAQGVSVDRKNSSFPLLATLSGNEEFGRRYKTALASFEDYVATHANAAADQLDSALHQALRKEGVFAMLTGNRAGSANPTSGGTRQ